MKADNLCPSCTEMSVTHMASNKTCTGGKSEGFNNCFDRNSVRKMKGQSDKEILRGIIGSSALSMNHTDSERRYIESRLRGIISRLK